MANTAEALRILAAALAPLAEPPAKAKPQPGDDEGKPEPADSGDESGESDDGSSEGSDPESDKPGDSDGRPSDKPSKGEARGDLMSGHGSASETPELPKAIQAIIQDETPRDPKHQAGLPALLDDTSPGYKIYTREHDRVIKAETLMAQIGGNPAHLRAELDKLIPDQGIVTRLATKLMRHILALQTRSWQFDQEDGKLDPARLARVVTAPMAPLAFKQEHEGQFRETAVTLLVDNSYSMQRGGKIQIAAVTADILARVLERCGVTVEVLGFTAHQHRRSAGYRCSSLDHIIYKDAAIPYRRTRENYGLMLARDTLHQNVDGEALIWAYNRLCCRPEPRRILIVISDGNPGDGVSYSRSGDCLLTPHLRYVIGEIEGRGHVELLAIGALHDVTQFYKHAITITDLPALGPALMTELTKMFAKK